MLVIVIILLYLVLIIALWNLVKVAFKRKGRIQNIRK